MSRIGEPWWQAKLDALTASDPRTRAGAAQDLAYIDEPDSRAALSRALHDDHPDVRFWAADSLAVLGSAEGVDVLLASLIEASSDCFVPAVRRLAYVGDPRAVAVLRPYAGRLRPHYEWPIRATLAALGDEASVAWLLGQIEQVRELSARREKDGFSRRSPEATLVAALLKKPSDESLDNLYLNHVDQLLAGIGDALGRTPEGRGVAGLIELMEYGDHGHVRAAAAFALGCSISPVGLLPLGSVLGGDPDDLTRCAAAEGLGRLGGDIAATLLMVGLDDVAAVSVACVHALGRTRSAAALAYLADIGAQDVRFSRVARGSSYTLERALGITD